MEVVVVILLLEQEEEVAVELLAEVVLEFILVQVVLEEMVKLRV